MVELCITGLRADRIGYTRSGVTLTCKKCDLHYINIAVNQFLCEISSKIPFKGRIKTKFPFGAASAPLATATKTQPAVNLKEIAYYFLFIFLSVCYKPSKFFFENDVKCSYGWSSQPQERRQICFSTSAAAASTPGSANFTFYCVASSSPATSTEGLGGSGLELKCYYWEEPFIIAKRCKFY